MYNAIMIKKDMTDNERCNLWIFKWQVISAFNKELAKTLFKLDISDKDFDALLDHLCSIFENKLRASDYDGKGVKQSVIKQFLNDFDTATSTYLNDFDNEGLIAGHTRDCCIDVLERYADSL